MVRALVISAIWALALPATVFAQQAQLGIPDQARAMLVKVVAAIKADQASTFAKIDKGEGGFREGDLFPYCFNITDGKVVASPITRLMGGDIRTEKDPTGNTFGNDLYAAAQKPESQITPVGPYMFPKPGTTAPLFPKVSFVERANNDIACAAITSSLFATSNFDRLPPDLSRSVGGSLQERGSRVILEAVGPEHVTAQGIDALVSRHVHHLEDRGAVLSGRGAEAGAQAVTGEGARSRPARLASFFTISGIQRCGGGVSVTRSPRSTERKT